MTGKRPEGIRCPRCGKTIRDESFPFCSDRCRLIDLLCWIDGDYRIPAEDTADEETAPVLQREKKMLH
jgi:endogenous inhibitor of DNA gyrase (YacG/DUF329 family)